MKVYIKCANKTEREIVKIIKDFNICPRVLRFNGNTIEYEKYDCTLSDFLYSNKEKSLISEIKQQCYNLINSLHLNCILHGDIHTENIVINLLTMEVKLIDFGLSSLFSQVDNKKMQIYNSLYQINPHAKTIDDLIKWELKCVGFMFAQ